jgi:hypothetical protein
VSIVRCEKKSTDLDIRAWTIGDGQGGGRGDGVCGTTLGEESGTWTVGSQGRGRDGGEHWASSVAWWWERWRWWASWWWWWWNTTGQDNNALGKSTHSKGEGGKSVFHDGNSTTSVNGSTSDLAKQERQEKAKRKRCWMKKETALGDTQVTL